eukprot:6201668-Pleurochrysis_carterae.AAC.3
MAINFEVMPLGREGNRAKAGTASGTCSTEQRSRLHGAQGEGHARVGRFRKVEHDELADCLSRPKIHRE